MNAVLLLIAVQRGVQPVFKPKIDSYLVYWYDARFEGLWYMVMEVKESHQQ